MKKFYLMMDIGKTPPKYIHKSIESAITEAKRLHEMHKSAVQILEVVGEVRSVEVPITRKEIVVNLNPEYSDDLPF